MKTNKATNNDAARFLDILAGTIAENFKTDALAPSRTRAARAALTEHLDGMTGVEGAYLCFAVMNLLGQRGDNKGMELVTQLIREAI